MNNENMIFDLIYHSDYEELRNFVHSDKCNATVIDEMQRSPIFVCLVETDYKALLILLENKDFVELFNSEMTIESMKGSYEFLNAFMNYNNPLDLIDLFAFIKNINQTDDNGSTLLDYFLWGLEGYSLSLFMNQATMLPNQKEKSIQSQMNKKVSTFFEKALDFGLDFNMKNKSGQTALENFIQSSENYSVFKSSVDFILTKIEKKQLEKSLNKEMLLNNTNKNKL